LSALIPVGDAGAVRVIRGSRNDDEATVPDAGDVQGRSSRLVRPGRQGRGSDRERSRRLSDLLGNAPDRGLDLRHVHTGERLDSFYWRDGQAVPEGQAAFRGFLRDWRRNEPAPTMPSLLDVLWAVQSQLTGASGIPPLHILSAYRTRQTNDALMRAGVTGVARDSYHLRGMAADFHCPTRSFDAVLQACLTVAPGGIGVYRAAGFIHVDVGPSRRWDG
ncbi:MAG: DUF882 domain-containing protein, partial [Pseudomonadota bacterium]